MLTANMWNEYVDRSWRSPVASVRDAVLMLVGGGRVFAALDVVTGATRGVDGDVKSMADPLREFSG